MKISDYENHVKAGLCILWKGQVRDFGGVEVMFCVRNILFELHTERIWINE